MKRTLTYAALALTLISLPALAAEDTDCYELSMTVSKAVTAAPDSVLVTVQQQVAANPACSCEVVKAAIVASEADRQLVGQIVSTAVEAAPENLRIIAQCAIAVAPDALPEVQAVLAQLDPQGGETGSAKGGYAKGGYAKGGKAPISAVAASVPRSLTGSTIVFNPEIKFISATRFEYDNTVSNNSSLPSGGHEGSYTFVSGPGDDEITVTLNIDGHGTPIILTMSRFLDNEDDGYTDSFDYQVSYDGEEQSGNGIFTSGNPINENSVSNKPASPLDGPYLVPGIPFIHPPFQTPPSISDIGDFLGNLPPSPQSGT